MKLKRICALLLSLFLILSVSACSNRADQSPAEPEKDSVLNNCRYLRELVDDMNEGKIPKKVTFRYDRGGEGKEITSKDRNTIIDFYNRLGYMKYLGKSNMSVTDSYHYIFFALVDGKEVGIRFEGEETALLGNGRYAVKDEGGVFELMHEMENK